MKRILKIAVIAWFIMLGSSLQNKTSAQYYNNRNDVTYQTFYDELSPYGRWIDYPAYGYVWVPDAGPGFRPYSSNGHWVWTDNYEWMWVSDYDWGWGPFHYGRWEEDPYYGWFWVPGYEWSPAWVAWRDGGDYYGWAPLRPGINISINFNIGNYSPPYSYWNFAPRRYINSPRLYDYCVDRRQNITIINYTTIIINNSGYNSNYGFRSGPRRYEAERYCGRINPVRIRDSYSPGRSQFRDNEVSFYRPKVKQENEREFAPRQYERYDRNSDFRTGRINNNRVDHGNNRDHNPARESNENKDFRQPRNRNEERVFRPDDRVKRNENPVNENNHRPFDKPVENNTRNEPFRRPANRNVDHPTQREPQQIERRQELPTRTFERRENNNQNRPHQNEPRNYDKPWRQTPQQIERRPEQQPRQFERREDGNQRQPSGDSNNGNKFSRKRF